MPVISREQKEEALNYRVAKSKEMVQAEKVIFLLKEIIIP